jgi:hypothetical protein
MPRGFGAAQQKRQGSKKAPLQEVQRLAQQQQDLAMQAEIAFFTQFHQEDAEAAALAWSIGVYNPLVELGNHARCLTPAEEIWLHQAKMAGWLQVEDEFDAIYFTAPPPNFSLEQADWYIRPDLTSFLEEPERLVDVIKNYPMS